MPAGNLSISKKLVQRSDRVKSVDMHPTEPWVIAGLYTGKAVIYNYNTQSVVKSFDVSDLPVRCVVILGGREGGLEGRGWEGLSWGPCRDLSHFPRGR